MYKLESDLSRKEYLSELQCCFRSPFLIYDERVCGIIIGPFFSVAYHSPHEWNRKISGEINRAWGYVKEVEGKSHVKFIRGKGTLSPFWLLFYFLLCLAILLLKGENVFSHPLYIWVSLIISIGVSVASAFQSLITEQGEAGHHEVTRLLRNPEEYYG